MNEIKIHRALISVSDKTGVVELARELQKWSIEIISTGGTLRTLTEAGIPARSVSEITGFPEILDGRLKTLHPKIHGGLLAVRDNPAHQKQLQELDIASIDLVVVNLYPFEQAVSKNGIPVAEAIEQIDIGGPTMLRAAAKNFKYKTVVVNPGRYGRILAEMEKQNGCVSEELRFELAREVFLRTAQYDSAIAAYLVSHTPDSERPLPQLLSLSLVKDADLRYGENPHQQAALYGNFHTFFEKLHGKELSF